MASDFTNWSAAEASAQYGLAAAEMFKVAGGGGGGGSRNGGGASGGAASSYGKGGVGGSGGKSGGGGSATPGGGTTIHVRVAGMVSPDNLVQVMAQMSNLAKDGRGYLTASNALTNGEKLA